MPYIVYFTKLVIQNHQNVRDQFISSQHFFLSLLCMQLLEHFFFSFFLSSLSLLLLLLLPSFCYLTRSLFVDFIYLFLLLQTYLFILLFSHRIHNKNAHLARPALYITLTTIDKSQYIHIFIHLARILSAALYAFRNSTNTVGD